MAASIEEITRDIVVAYLMGREKAALIGDPATQGKFIGTLFAEIDKAVMKAYRDRQ